MVYRIREDTVFSNQVFFGLRLIACSVMFYPFITFVSYEFSSKSIEELTKGQFTAQFRSSNIVIFLTIFYLLLMMSPLIKKAIKLQQEKDLTI
jgi:hypothetical protein